MEHQDHQQQEQEYDRAGTFAQAPIYYSNFTLNNHVDALTALNEKTILIEKERRWPFCIYFDIRAIQSHFINLAERVLILANKLPEGEDIYKQWELNHSTLPFVAMQARQFRLNYPYENLRQWMQDFEYSLIIIAPKDEQAKRVSKKYNALKASHNNMNWNKIRVPFVFSILNSDLP